MGIDPLSAGAQDGFLLKVQMPGTNYCHLKFPAIREDTLSWARPVLKDARDGDTIDYYGSCDFDPTGRAAVQAQRVEKQHRFTRDYND